MEFLSLHNKHNIRILRIQTQRRQIIGQLGQMLDLAHPCGRAARAGALHVLVTAAHLLAKTELWGLQKSDGFFAQEFPENMVKQSEDDQHWHLVYYVLMDTHRLSHEQPGGAFVYLLVEFIVSLLLLVVVDARNRHVHVKGTIWFTLQIPNISMTVVTDGMWMS